MSQIVSDTKKNFYYAPAVALVASGDEGVGRQQPQREGLEDEVQPLREQQHLVLKQLKREKERADGLEQQLKRETERADGLEQRVNTLEEQQKNNQELVTKLYQATVNVTPPPSRKRGQPAEPLQSPRETKRARQPACLNMSSEQVSAASDE